ncbi:MAG TPA: 3',5'-cyclic nucleotide phosphodiesterase [bacterium]|nr:3',5'-cyclic nucleotide phosphodiesterase [bacterium]
MTLERRHFMPGSREPSHLKPAVISRGVRVYALGGPAQLAEFVLSLLELEGSARQVGADPARLGDFVRAIAERYRPNPYHNLQHAADVTNTMAWLLTRPTFHSHLPPNLRFWLLIGAIVHDVDHPGHNNQWEMYVRSSRAERYHNHSVLENHSLALARELLARPALRFQATMDPADVAQGERILEQVVLATDFAFHKPFMEHFGRLVAAAGRPVDFAPPDFLLEVGKALLKAADIANTTKPFPQAKLWGLRVMQEFWAQGRMEKQGDFPVGPLNDEDRVDLNLAQAGFIRFAALDLFQLLAQLEPELEPLVETLRENIRQYQRAARCQPDSVE